MPTLPRLYAQRRSLFMAAMIPTGSLSREMKKMTTVTAINKIDFDHGNMTPMQRSLRAWNAGLFASAFFGIVFGLGGVTIGFLAIVELVAPSTGLYTSGTLLMGVSFILFGLAAHCLDRADVADKAIRRECCRQHGLKG